MSNGILFAINVLFLFQLQGDDYKLDLTPKRKSSIDFETDSSEIKRKKSNETIDITQDEDNEVFDCIELNDSQESEDKTMQVT